MSEKKDVVINIKPFHIELKNVRDNSFELWFYDNIGTDCSRRKIVKIHFESWWIKYIARLLWKVQKAKQKEADNMSSALRGDSDD